MYTNIVVCKIKEATEGNIKYSKDTILSMEGKIDVLKGIEVGSDDIRSDRSYDIALITRFDNKEDYLTYDLCEYHDVTVKGSIRPYLESSKTVDYYL